MYTRKKMSTYSLHRITHTVMIFDVLFTCVNSQHIA
jgi:hypothetical protein